MARDFIDIDFHVRGVAPLMMHNGQLADPLNPIVRAMKEFTSKRNKTESDHAELGRLEHLGGLYLDESGTVVVPDTNIEAMLLKSAKKAKKGEQAKCGLWAQGTFPLIYKGPSNAKELFLDKRFVDKRGVVVSRSRVMRVRPVFRQWELKFTVTYSTEEWSEHDVVSLVERAGRKVGLCEMAPKYGRFDVVPPAARKAA